MTLRNAEARSAPLKDERQRNPNRCVTIPLHRFGYKGQNVVLEGHFDRINESGATGYINRPNRCHPNGVV